MVMKLLVPTSRRVMVVSGVIACVLCVMYGVTGVTYPSMPGYFAVAPTWHIGLLIAFLAVQLYCTLGVINWVLPDQLKYVAHNFSEGDADEQAGGNHNQKHKQAQR